MMNQNIRGDAACARPFHPIRDIEFSPGNTLSSASFSHRRPLPLLQLRVDRLVGAIFRETKS